ncbi:hypothetical protein [Pannonibacter phragmitetus]|uniref:hypothetical protein n=1 Tax=Pannonibacter phragmitetus TaxID=121719 RepID=UPI0011C0262F|nr:hypothetical protein [Pannonibacter phragmitetus]
MTLITFFSLQMTLAKMLKLQKHMQSGSRPPDAVQFSESLNQGNNEAKRQAEARPQPALPAQKRHNSSRFPMSLARRKLVKRVRRLSNFKT